MLSDGGEDTAGDVQISIFVLPPLSDESISFGNVGRRSSSRWRPSLEDGGVIMEDEVPEDIDIGPGPVQTGVTGECGLEVIRLLLN